MKNLFKKKSLRIEKLIKKTLNFDKKTDIKRIKVSKTDSECGVFHKGEHKKVFAYSTNTACDKNNFVLGSVLTPRNYHDSLSFAELYQQVTTSYPNISTIVYRTPAIAKLIIDDNRTPIFLDKRPMTKDGFFKKYEYVYDEYYDCYVCPNNEVLKYSTTNREGYKEYKSNQKIYKKCQFLEKCTEGKNKTKTCMGKLFREGRRYKAHNRN